MAAHDVLRQAAALVEAGWSQADSHALNASGAPVPLFGGLAGDTARAGVNPAAVRFSLYGAVVKALHMAPGIDPNPIWLKLDEIVRGTGYVTGGTNHLHPVIGYNNAEGRTQAEVQAVLLLAAEELDPHDAPVPMPDAPVPTAIESQISPLADAIERAETAKTIPHETLSDVMDRIGPSPFKGME